MSPVTNSATPRTLAVVLRQLGMFKIRSDKCQSWAPLCSYSFDILLLIGPCIKIHKLFEWSHSLPQIQTIRMFASTFLISAY